MNRDHATDPGARGTSDPRRPLVEAVGLVKQFVRPSARWLGGPIRIPAVRGVDLQVAPGETLGLVGESGSGKSTLGRLLIRLEEPDRGHIRFDGVDLLALRGRRLRRMRRHFQIVFQDAYGALNPRMRVGSLVGEPLAIHRIGGSRAERRRRVVELLELVGLRPEDTRKYPHQFSGGQRQRVGIARAIATEPRFVVLDEPVSALDPPVQAQIVNLFMELQERLGLAYLFIAHDMRLVEHLSDRVAVMYLGRIVEEGPAEAVYREPLHPYTRLLLASTPEPRPGVARVPVEAGEPASAADLPPGCPFHPRCPLAEPICRVVEPELRAVAPARRVACHVVHSEAGLDLPAAPADRPPGA